LNGEDYARAKEMIEAFMNGPTAEGQEWVCTECGESICQQLSECWNCGKERIMLND
jgi:rubrerythrin